MFKTTETSVNTKKVSAKTLVPIGLVVILLLVYGAGIITLPGSILSSYQNKNCDSTLSLDRIYTNIYPGFLQDKALVDPIKECEAYLSAASNEEKGSWREAYDAYQVYANTYPQGLYVEEAHAHSAAILLSLAQEQIAQKTYVDAVENLKLVVSDYADTGSAGEALALFPSLHASWSADLREAGDFGGAEQVLNDYRVWAQADQKPELEKDARSALAQAYLAWGQTLQTGKQFEEALKKFDLAGSVDPEPQSDSGSAAQAKTGQMGVYIDWGNNLLEQKDFAAAIEKFKLAGSLTNDQNGDNARDALANGYIQWAADLSASEDFRGALEQMESAKTSAATDATKQKVETALGEVSLAFSNSSGSQAQGAMKAAYQAVCVRHEKPALPIFGLNKDTIKVGLYGLTASLPEELAAGTPGEMHYIACVEVEERVVEVRYRRIYKIIHNHSQYRVVTLKKMQSFWHISLRDAETGEEYKTAIFDGGPPPPYPQGDKDLGDGLYYGKPPDYIAFTNWLQSVTK